VGKKGLGVKGGGEKEGHDRFYGQQKKNIGVFSWRKGVVRKSNKGNPSVQKDN